MKFELDGKDSSYVRVYCGPVCDKCGRETGIQKCELLLDEARIWANEIGAIYFHLGGRLEAEKDLPFRFEAGFSEPLHRAMRRRS